MIIDLFSLFVEHSLSGNEMFFILLLHQGKWVGDLLNVIFFEGIKQFVCPEHRNYLFDGDIWCSM